MIKDWSLPLVGGGVCQWRHGLAPVVNGGMVFGEGVSNLMNEYTPVCD